MVEFESICKRRKFLQKNSLNYNCCLNRKYYFSETFFCFQKVSEKNEASSTTSGTGVLLCWGSRRPNRTTHAGGVLPHENVSTAHNRGPCQTSRDDALVRRGSVPPKRSKTFPMFTSSFWNTSHVKKLLCPFKCRIFNNADFENSTFKQEQWCQIFVIWEYLNPVVWLLKNCTAISVHTSPWEFLWILSSS